MAKDKEEFLRRKKGIRNEADMTAQRLVNVYRQLSVLGENALERYNKELLEKHVETLLSINAINVVPGNKSAGAVPFDDNEYTMHTATSNHKHMLVWLAGGASLHQGQIAFFFSFFFSCLRKSLLSV